MPRARRAAMAAAIACVALTGVAAAQSVQLPIGNNSVSGRVVAADTGAPLAGAEVILQGINLPEALAYRSTTDGSGTFTFTSVYGPREYRLRATKAGFYYRAAGPAVTPGMPIRLGERGSVDNATVALMRGGAVEGRILDIYGDPVDHIPVYLLRLSYGSDGGRMPIPFASSAVDVTNDLGQFRIYAVEPGDYIVVAGGRKSGSGIPTTFSPQDPVDTAPTYYPGTIVASEAQVLSVSAGQQLSLQFTLSEQRTVTVSGTVHLSNGRPAAGMQVAVRSDASTSAVTLRTLGRVSPAGTFSIHGLAPGVHAIEVYNFVMPNDGSPLPRERGLVTVAVGADDIRDLAIVTVPGAEVTGTVVFEQPYTGNFFQVSAAPEDLSVTAGSTSSEPIGEDGRFTLTNVANRVWLGVSNQWWTIKSVSLDGRDLTADDVIDLGGRKRVSGLRIVVSDRLTNVSARATDDRKQPLAEHQVIVFRLDAPSLPANRRVRNLRTDDKGEFILRGLRPGNYVVAVTTGLELGAQNAPDFQDRLRQYGHRFTLDEGEAVTLELGLTTGL